MTKITRRAAVSGIAATLLGSPFLVRGALAQGGTTLESLRAAGVVRIGLANQPPYSGLNPDGSVTGFVPELVREIMARLGVGDVEPFVATYGELIPGLQAGRWQMIAASFRITADRCQQVLFTDPVTFDGGALAYVPTLVSDVPASLQELAESDLTVGVLQGSYLVAKMDDLGIGGNRVSQFPDNPALIDGIQTRRVHAAVSTNASLQQLRQQRGGAFEIVYPLPEDPPVGSSPAFSTSDGELHAAFQQELRAMREEGAVDEIGARFGFGPPPEGMVGLSAEEACRRVGA